jgi:CheY-like chemotaxis protein
MPLEGLIVSASVRIPNKKVVLLAEDEFLVRLHAVHLVEQAGFEAVEAANADEAISILEAPKDIRTIFTDIHMPGSMDGLKLAHAVRKRWPPIELILTSEHFNIAKNKLPAQGCFFPKPYQDAAIIDALRHLGS